MLSLCLVLFRICVIASKMVLDDKSVLSEMRSFLKGINLDFVNPQV